MKEISFTTTYQRRFYCVVFTDTQEIEKIDYLAHKLPEVYFQIVAKTEMGTKLYDIQQQYPNIQLYPAVSVQKLEQLKVRMDLYLDISLSQSTHDFVKEVADLQKPIFAFKNTRHGSFGQRIYSLKDIDCMVEAISSLASSEYQKEDSVICVKSIDDTLDYIIENNSSVIRFGDGEMDLMLGKSIPYQLYDSRLSQQLKEIVALQSNSQLVIGLPDVFSDRSNFTPAAKGFWEGHLAQYLEYYIALARAKWYGTTFISRLYIDYIDKSQAPSQFDKLKEIWENRDILIVEGFTSRSGVGNDLFDGAKSIKRIICPSHNAYHIVEKIKNTVLEHIENRLVLCMLGPTAKVLTYELVGMGHRVIDIGHIDSEYEWMKMGATTKVKLSHKHTAEHNFD